METFEDLSTCIEKCTLLNASNIVLETFYYDTRFGVKIDDGELHPAYKLCESNEAITVVDIAGVVKQGNEFIVRVVLNDNNIIDTITVRYFPYDKSFIVKKYDPIKIIRCILAKAEFKDFFICSGHPSCLLDYKPNYWWIPDSLNAMYSAMKKTNIIKTQDNLLTNNKSMSETKVLEDKLIENKAVETETELIENKKDDISVDSLADEMSTIVFNKIYTDGYIKSIANNIMNEALHDTKKTIYYNSKVVNKKSKNIRRIKIEDLEELDDLENLDDDLENNSNYDNQDNLDDDIDENENADDQNDQDDLDEPIESDDQEDNLDEATDDEIVDGNQYMTENESDDLEQLFGTTFKKILGDTYKKSKNNKIDPEIIYEDDDEDQNADDQDENSGEDDEDQNADDQDENSGDDDGQDENNNDEDQNADDQDENSGDDDDISNMFRRHANVSSKHSKQIPLKNKSCRLVNKNKSSALIRRRRDNYNFHSDVGTDQEHKFAEEMFKMLNRKNVDTNIHFPHIGSSQVTFSKNYPKLDDRDDNL